MKVELEQGVWLAAWAGDPGRTTIEASAKVFHTKDDAMVALAEARKYNPFESACLCEDWL